MTKGGPHTRSDPDRRSDRRFDRDGEAYIDGTFGAEDYTAQFLGLQIAASGPSIAIPVLSAVMPLWSMNTPVA